MAPTLREVTSNEAPAWYGGDEAAAWAAGWNAARQALLEQLPAEDQPADYDPLNDPRD